MYIPKKIHLTCKDKNNIDNNIWKRCLIKYKLAYPDYKIILYDNNDIYNLIDKYYPMYSDKIRKIKIGAILADIFRYLILYLEGGIYSDLDCEPIRNINNLLKKDFKYYHGNKNNNFWIYRYKKNIINRQWDYTHNICNNCKLIGINKIKNNIKLICNGHDIKNPSTILCYEIHSDYMGSEILNNKKWCYKKIGICQWFIITKPKQYIFIKMFHNIMKNIDMILNISKKDKDYHYNVINTTGPLAFTKTVLKNLHDRIIILPCDFFCSGSFNKVPFTKNSYIRHHFTSSWL